MRRPALVLVPLVLLALGSAAPASAATPPRTVRLISGGGSSTDNAFSAAISADGSRAVFTTTEKLLPADVNAVSDVYARDANGTLQLVSSGKGSSGASFLAVSANGDRIVYFTPNAELPSDTDAQGDLYERRRSGALRQISAGNGAFGVTFIAQSDNGDHVVFVSSENISGTGDSDGQQDFFDRRADGSIRLLTPGTPSTVPLVFGPLALSSDGSTLFIHTTDALAPADADVAFDTYSVPTAGGPYTLLTPGTTTGTFAFASRDGRRVWFTATDALLPADTDTATDIYERDAGGAIKLISGGTANTSAALITTLVDGSVIFSTAEKLLPADGDTTGIDLYERRPDGSLRLLSGGTVDADSANLVGVNADGTVVFYTSESLLPSDGDAQLDVYARRADGTLALVTPGTPTQAIVSFPGTPIPATRARTLFDGPDIPGTGDSNGLGDTYEVLAGGPRALASTAAGAHSSGEESADGSRILFTTTSTIPGTGDSDTALDVYEADFAVPVISGVPAMSGAGRVGRTQTCSTLTATGESLTNTFSWFRDASAILGASGKTYKPVLADAGHRLRCRFTSANGIGADTADSVARKVPPAAKTAKLGGFPIVGTKLSCTSFAGATRTTYKWKRGSKTVRGRTTRTYKVARADLGKRVSCSAVARNGTLSTSVSQRVTVPRQCKVPNVRGLTPADAKTRLGNAGCRSTTKRISGSGVPVGRVLGTSPGRGKKRANGARITINVRK